MSLEGEEYLTRRGVPQPGRLVIGSGQHARAIGAEGDGKDFVLMPLEGAEFLPMTAPS
jgi:hypothetical protein